MCRPVHTGVSKWNYLPAGGGEETMDNSKHKITKPARILAITIKDSALPTFVSAIGAPNVSALIPSVLLTSRLFSSRKDFSQAALAINCLTVA